METFPAFSLLLFLAFCASALVAWCRSPRQQGKWGEWIVAKRLRKGLPAGYKILDDVYLPLPDGTTTQIDHLVVSPCGVFVVETKKYSGWIFGGERDATWTQSLRGRKSRFQNPLRQNYRHVRALAENIGLDPSCIHGVVAFTGNCEFKTPMPENVVFSARLASFIRGFDSPLFDPRQVEEIVAAIEKRRASVGQELKACHVANLRKRFDARDAEGPRCPRCGGPMVLRKRKRDGKAFWGCLRYPACRGIAGTDG